uniref:Uncharacterized protein n=1 Tax=Populus trichocarpa TaxID=3694 RepID=B9HPQ5_POPTR
MGIWLESKVNKFLQRLKRLEERRKLPAKLQGLVVSIEVTLKLGKCTIVMTNPSDEEKEKEMKYLISNHIDIKDDDNDEFLIEEDVEEASPIFESENKSLMDELKEVNLSIIENPRPSFININLSPKEERDYMKLLIEY